LGYGKIETIGSVLVSGVLLFAGVSVGWSSLLQVFEFALPAYMFEYVSMIQIGHSHSHAGLGSGEVGGHSHSHVSDGVSDSSIVANSRPIPNINAAWLAGGSVIVKEMLYRKTMQIAVETNSKVLVANAWHHRVDSLTAVVALLTVAGGNIFNVAWLDSIGGLCVSMLIIKAGWDSFKTSIVELIDKGEDAESEVFSKVHDIITDEIKNVANNEFKIEKLSVLNSGAITNVYMTLSTSKEFRLKELNQIESNLVTAIKADYEFVRNIFILFKDSEQQKISQDRSTEHSHENKK
jgi:divalent metal cation (Fe/Co/Zn/Cd) transporter